MGLEKGRSLEFSITLIHILSPMSFSLLSLLVASQTVHSHIYLRGCALIRIFLPKKYFIANPLYYRNFVVLEDL